MDLLTLTARMPAAKNAKDVNTMVHSMMAIHTSRMVVRNTASVEPNELTPWPMLPPGMITTFGPVELVLLPPPPPSP